MVKLILKAGGDHPISFCDCDPQADFAVATSGQLDCPWCGCGWLFTCSRCRRAFTWGVVADSTRTAEEVARHLAGLGPDDAVGAEDREEYEWLEHGLRDLAPGTRVVLLDGGILPLDEPVDLHGWMSRHRFDRLPHLDAPSAAALDALFGDKTYWLERAHHDAATSDTN
ncbi:hypothetical protein ACQ5SO_19880 [Rhodovulum sp. DZ06]|uniref:hypothetical protein n=1 Tax=Rhodovulum sp. DZ06 TaxID=3425126 RepID=UPI003D33A9DC